MYGDVSFEWIRSGSTATSAATAHLLFGAYNALSNLNSKDVLLIQVQASAANLRIGPSGSPTNNIGLRVIVTDPYIDLPPMQAGNASLLHFARTATNDATADWIIWRRV